MARLAELLGTRVVVDSAPLIYFIEEHPAYIHRLRPFFQAVDNGEIQVVASTVTLLEVLVQPIRRGDEALAHEYNDILLTSPNISTVAVTPATAQIAAELRAQHNLKTPDAIQLATAVDHGASAFLTNDREFPALDRIKIVRVHEL